MSDLFQMNTIEFTIPVRTVSESNKSRHEFWAVTAKRVKSQRRLGFLFTRQNTILIATEVIRRIMLTRLAPKRLDTGNNPSAMKAIQDGIADALKINDGDERIDWIYKQEKSKVYGVRVRIEYA